MISLETIIERVSSLGPNWEFLIRNCTENKKKPGKFLVNISYNEGFYANEGQYFPVFGDDLEAAFEESFRRASVFAKFGVR